LEPDPDIAYLLMNGHPPTKVYRFAGVLITYPSTPHHHLSQHTTPSLISAHHFTGSWPLWI